MHPMLNIAVRAARTAGKFIAKSFEDLENIQVENKGQNDFVSNVDRQAEQLIIDTIKRSYPKHSFIGEESGHQIGEHDDFQWVIDPIDGTVNFINGIPHFAISIALRVKGRTEQAVVYDPIRDELFTASRGAGAQLNGKRIRVGKKRELKGALLGTAFPHRQRQHLGSFLQVFEALFDQAGDIRRSGCASLDLAYVAAARTDGHFELNLKPWDFMAADLLIREAGGLVTDFSGGHNYASSGNLVTGNAKVLKGMLSTMRPHLTPAISQ